MTLSGQVYVCSNQETFDSVSILIYGDEKYSADLMSANPTLCEKIVFTGGEILNLPVVEITETESAPMRAPWKE